MKVIGSNFTAPFSTILGIGLVCISILNQKLLLLFERKTNITCKGFLKNANPWCHSIPCLQCIRFIYVHTTYQQQLPTASPRIVRIHIMQCSLQCVLVLQSKLDKTTLCESYLQYIIVYSHCVVLKFSWSHFPHYARTYCINYNLLCVCIGILLLHECSKSQFYTAEKNSC